MATPHKLIDGSERSFAITWKENGVLLPLSTGYTFVVKIGHPDDPALLTKSANVTGADTAPNLTVPLTQAEIAALPNHRLFLQATATHTASGAKYVLQTEIQIDPSVK